MEQNQVKVGQVYNLSTTHGVINPSPSYTHILSIPQMRGPTFFKKPSEKSLGNSIDSKTQ